MSGKGKNQLEASQYESGHQGMFNKGVINLNPKVHSPLFAAVLLLLRAIHFIGGRPGLLAIGFKHFQ